MWLLLILALAAIVALNFWWARRLSTLESALDAQTRTLEDLKHEHEQVTLQKQAEQQALFNSMTEGVLVLDAHGRIQLVNQSLQRLFRLNKDVRGQTIMEVFRLPDLAEVIRRLQKERVISGFELELPGMEERWLQVNAAAVLDREGAQRGVILVFHELTRLRQLENTRQEFVANVSHELRTPLSLIKGFVETLLEGAKNDPELSTRFLNTIEKHTDRLTFLIEDLLTISRLESGGTVMNFQQVDLGEAVARAVDDLQSRAREKEVTIENSVPPGLVARADAERLHQVLCNLIENAIKYGRAQGRVAVGARAVAPDKIEGWIDDDGPGIPPEARERVFERFYRVDRARSRDTGGTGLGLSIVKHIIQAHGGEVWVKSELGAGATFFFTLPTAEKPIDQPQP
ncbi:MAG: ATP-binding protein [Verrucomicrobia subdivision 3 bacterium]|nr:ATP-binding protein [Limisphaerales bacterium]